MAEAHGVRGEQKYWEGPWRSVVNPWASLHSKNCSLWRKLRWMPTCTKWMDVRGIHREIICRLRVTDEAIGFSLLCFTSGFCKKKMKRWPRTVRSQSRKAADPSFEGRKVAVKLLLLVFWVLYYSRTQYGCHNADTMWFSYTNIITADTDTKSITVILFKLLVS